MPEGEGDEVWGAGGPKETGSMGTLAVEGEIERRVKSAARGESGRTSLPTALGDEESLKAPQESVVSTSSSSEAVL